MLLKIKLSSFIGETFNQPPTMTALLLLNKQKYLEVSNMHACMGKAKHFLRGEEERYQGGGGNKELALNIRTQMPI